MGGILRGLAAFVVTMVLIVIISTGAAVGMLELGQWLR